MPLMTASERPFKSTVRQMSSLVDPLQPGYFGFSPSDTWAPAVNLYETDNAYLICVDLAGVDKNKLDIQLHGQQISIKGARQAPVHPDGATNLGTQHQPRRVRVHLMEIDHGSFSRLVEVPENVHRDSINAIYRDGLLWIELPRTDAAGK